MNGKIIVIEGLDGSGKNTQAKLLLNYFDNQKISARYLSFPDYSSLSSSLVKMYLNSEFGNSPDDVNAYAAASFYAVDRYASFKKDWRKNYLNGDIIVCDRYTTSNAIYQMCKLDKKYWKNYLSWLYDYEYNKLNIPKPDIIIYLKVMVEISQKLINKRYLENNGKKDLHESNVLFLKKCEETVNFISSQDNWHIINCYDNLNKNIYNKNQIHEKILNIIKNY